MSTSIPGVAIFVAKPGSEERVAELLLGLVAPSNTEDGVVFYNFHRDRDNPRRFVFTEEWASQAALDRHIASEHVKDAFNVLPDLLESSNIIMLERLTP